ncbi:Wound-responsive family protein [Trema orientale]|uniref:Wound-responsive family protein n=1 Tax=Trema orientale TaxID=63057 RepID=A0A2P5F3S1_TREOI|nr:Wound-responsive family protein [Trema orientale]
MSAACRAWIVAASIGAVEALKDQGVCRWNHALRSMQQHVKSNIRSYSQAKKLSPSSVSAALSNQINRSKEEKLRKVMELSSWGPSTTRF